MSEPEIERDRWGRPRPKRWKPDEPTPEHLAYLAHLRAINAACDAADDGLLPCPDCGGTKGVRQFCETGSFRGGGSGRMHYVICPCGRKGPVVYGAEPSRRAWNAIERKGEGR